MKPKESKTKKETKDTKKTGDSSKKVTYVDPKKKTGTTTQKTQAKPAPKKESGKTISKPGSAISTSSTRPATGKTTTEKKTSTSKPS